jgi:magnesium chelatase subunit D
MLLEAVRAAIPDDLLARLLAAGAAAKGAQGAGAGSDRRSHRRGRPAGTMRGTAREGARVDLIATLRTAAPWQPLRRQLPGAAADRVLVRADDIRVKRFRQRAERVVIFVVDASGSTALARLAEAKGAIELMLGQAYVERQQVALIAFRGTGAEILLPPTRSLVMTKRRLAGLPGGGGTPLAGGLRAALELALAARRRGLVPHLAMLTDGRANVALDGSPGRGRAQEDALRLAQAVRYAGVPGLVIDTGNRPSEQARAIAAAMVATHLPLPRADARALSAALDSALAGAA